ncbi:dual specificity protein phosphatase 4 [Meleagris gallopavo]|nr:dual specificity protein phosphatase 4 [Meleagris gallopavo]
MSTQHISVLGVPPNSASRTAKGFQKHWRAVAHGNGPAQGLPTCCRELGCSPQGSRLLSIPVASSSGQGHVRIHWLQLSHSTVSTAVTLLRAFLLTGGYERFASEYPEFCAKTKTLSSVSPPSSTESLDLGFSSCGTPFHDQGGPVEILPFLYLGSAYHAARRDMLDALGITALLNVSSDCPNHFEGHYQYKCIPVEDNHKADISSWFMEAIEYIDSVKECCGRVLVHCQAGISRSATICLAYLMMKKRVKLEEAFEFVKQRRSIISPNFSFMGQLLQFESQVLATSCAVEAASPSGTLRERGKTTSTPTSQFVFSFPVSVGVHATPSNLPYLHSPITTSPSC